MSHRKIENALKNGLNASLPDILDSVLQTPVSKMTNEQYQALLEPPLDQHKAKIFRPRLTLLRPGLSFALVAILLCLGLWGYYKPAALIAIDVNPGFEVTTNAYKRVLQVNGLDSNAQQILTGLKLTNTSLDNTIETIMGSLIQKGYLEQPNTTILVSVAATNAVLSQTMENQILNDMNQVLASDNKSATIYIQTLDTEKAPVSQNNEENKEKKQKVPAVNKKYIKEKDVKEKDVKEKHEKQEKPVEKQTKKQMEKPTDSTNNKTENLSFGKKALIQKLKQNNISFNEEDLANITLQEINALLKQQDKDLQTILDQTDNKDDRKDNKTKDRSKNKNKEKPNEKIKDEDKDKKSVNKNKGKSH